VIDSCHLPWSGTGARVMRVTSHLNDGSRVTKCDPLSALVEGRIKDRSTLFQKPGRNQIRVRLLLRTVHKNLRYSDADSDISDSDAGLKEEK